MPDYTWVCHSCKVSNSLGTQVCQACGFPTEASADQIDEAVTGIKRQPRQSWKEWIVARRQEIAALPWWKKVFAYVLRAIQFVGALVLWLGIFNLSVQAAVFGLAMGMIAEVLFQLLKGKPNAQGIH